MDHSPELITAAEEVVSLTYSLPFIKGSNFRTRLRGILDSSNANFDQVKGIQQEIEGWIQESRKRIGNAIFLEELDALKDGSSIELSKWRNENTAISRTIDFPHAGFSFDLIKVKIQKIGDGTHFLLTLQSGVEIKVPREYIPALGISYETKTEEE